MCSSDLIDFASAQFRRHMKDAAETSASLQEKE